LPKEDIYKIIEKITRSEGLSVDAKTKEALYELSQGDCRRMENLMQSSAAIKDKITEEVIYSIASAAEPEEINDVLALCVKGDFGAAKNKLLDTMLNHGLSGLDVIKQVQQEIWKLKDVESRKKLEMIKECGEAEFRMVEGSDEFIQLEALLAKFVLINS
jgi:replication factor C small subunit